MDYILSFDVGTSAVKAALVSPEGEIAAVSDQAYPLYSPKPGYAEQDPQDYWQAACASAKRAIGSAKIKPSQVKGVVFSTQWKGIIPIDRQGVTLHPNILWLDARAAEQSDRLNSKMGCFVGPASQYWPRLMWVRENLPEIYDRAELLLCVDSYLKWKATGQATADVTNSFIRADDSNLQDYYDRILCAGNLDANKFPPITSATEEAGKVTRQAAEELGICPGTKVFGGCGDIPAIAIGAGCVGLGKEHMYLGSSGWMGRVDPKPMLAENFLFQALEAGRFLTVSGMQSACMSQNWAIDVLYSQEKKQMGDDIFALIDQETGAVPPGADHLVATPWIHGETPPLSRFAHGMFVNLHACHTRAHMIVALRESIAYHLRMRRELLDGASPASPMRIVGGGAKSDQWMQAFADILDTPVEVPANARHAGALGAAACAAVGLGWWGSLTEADQRIGVQSTYEPRAQYATCYDRLYQAFCALYPALKNVFESLNQED